MPDPERLVSIIIRTYNRRRFILETIANCQAQTHRPIEIVVVDDGSTDGTRDLLQPQIQLNKMRYIYQQHTGPSHAANTGLKAACGEYIQFLDSDDLLLPQKIEKQIAQLRNSPQSVAICDYRYFENCTPEHLYGGRANPSQPVELDDFASVFRLYAVLHSFLFPRSVFESYGLFRADLPGAEDLEFFVRLVINRVNFVFSPEPLVLYRRHVEGLTNDPVRMESGRILALKYIREYLKQTSWKPFSQKEVNEMEEICRYDLARHLLLGNQKARSWLHLLKAWKMSPRRRQPKTLLLFFVLLPWLDGSAVLARATQMNDALWHLRGSLHKCILCLVRQPLTVIRNLRKMADNS